MNTLITTAENLKKGQMICENGGMCFEILSVEHINNNVKIKVDNSFSPKMNAESIIKKNQKIMILE